jgi:hypothetical protein
MNYVKFWATIVGGLAVVALFSALFGDGLRDVLAGRDIPPAATMLGLGAVGLTALWIVGKHLLRHLPGGEDETPRR